jgi:hypothetical protein
MSVAKLNRLLPIGTILLSVELGLHIWTHGDYSESISGFLIGIAVVLIIAGFMNRFSKQPDSMGRP